jgi:hypothetical protein
MLESAGRPCRHDVENLDPHAARAQIRAAAGDREPQDIVARRRRPVSIADPDVEPQKTDPDAVVSGGLTAVVNVASLASQTRRCLCR